MKSTNMRRPSSSARHHALRDKALRIQKKAQLRTHVCLRLQKQLRKPPAVARALTTGVTRLLLLAQHTCEPSDEVFAAIVQRVIDERAADAAPTRKLVAAETRTPARRPSPDLQTTRQARRRVEPDVYRTEAQRQQGAVGGPSTVRPTANGQTRARDIWTTMVESATADDLRARARARDQAVRDRRTWAAALARQKAAADERARAVAQDDRRLYDEAQARWARATAAEQQQAAERAQQAHAQAQAQAAQRAERVARRQAEDAQRAAHERQAVERLRRQQAADDARAREKKRAERAQMHHVLAENRLCLERKAKLKADERQYERRLAEEYVQMEEKKDRQRKQALEDLSARIQAKMKFFTDTSKAETAAKEREEERRLLRYQLAYEQQQAQAEKDKERQRHERNVAQQEELRRQMAQKKRQEQLARQEFNQQAQIWKREQQQAQARESEAENKRYLRNTLQQQWLRDQMREKEHQKHLADHTPLEIQLNKSILMKIGQNVVENSEFRVEGQGLST